MSSHATHESEKKCTQLPIYYVCPTNWTLFLVSKYVHTILLISIQISTIFFFARLKTKNRCEKINCIKSDVALYNRQIPNELTSLTYILQRLSRGDGDGSGDGGDDDGVVVGCSLTVFGMCFPLLTAAAIVVVATFIHSRANPTQWTTRDGKTKND